jgi:hypothetical protein
MAEQGHGTTQHTAAGVSHTLTVIATSVAPLLLTLREGSGVVCATVGVPWLAVPFVARWICSPATHLPQLSPSMMMNSNGTNMHAAMCWT